MPKSGNQVQLSPYLANNLHVQINIVCLNVMVKIYPHFCFLDNFVESYASLHALSQHAKIKKLS